MKKKNKTLSIVLVALLLLTILGAGIYFSYSAIQQSILDDVIYTNFSRSWFMNYGSAYKSSNEFGSYVLQTSYCREGLDGPTNYVIMTIENNKLDLTNLGSNLFSQYSYDSSPNCGNPGSRSHIPLNTVSYTTNLSFNTENYSFISFILDTSQSSDCYCSGNQYLIDACRTPTSNIEVYLFNNETNYILTTKTFARASTAGSESKSSSTKITLFKDFDSFILDINGERNYINIEPGIYEVALKNYLVSDASQCKSNTRANAKISSLEVKNYTPLDYVYVNQTYLNYIHNITYQNNTIYINQTGAIINNTIYNNSTLNLTCTTLGCPTGFSCIGQVCILTEEDSNLKTIYWIVGILAGVLTIGSIIYAFWRKRKK